MIEPKLVISRGARECSIFVIYILSLAGMGWFLALSILLIGILQTRLKINCYSTLG